MTTTKPWREVLARHTAAYEAFLWEQDHPTEVAWLNSPEGEQFKQRVRAQVKQFGFCRSNGCSNLAQYEWGQCGECYRYDLIDEQADWERERMAEAQLEDDMRTGCW